MSDFYVVVVYAYRIRDHRLLAYVLPVQVNICNPVVESHGNHLPVVHIENMPGSQGFGEVPVDNEPHVVQVLRCNFISRACVVLRDEPVIAVVLNRTRLCPEVYGQLVARVQAVIIGYVYVIIVTVKLVSAANLSRCGPICTGHRAVVAKS